MCFPEPQTQHLRQRRLGARIDLGKIDHATPVGNERCSAICPMAHLVIDVGGRSKSVHSFNNRNGDDIPRARRTLIKMKKGVLSVDRSLSKMVTNRSGVLPLTMIGPLSQGRAQFTTCRECSI